MRPGDRGTYEPKDDEPERPAAGTDAATRQRLVHDRRIGLTGLSAAIGGFLVARFMLSPPWGDGVAIVSLLGLVPAGSWAGRTWRTGRILNRYPWVPSEINTTEVPLGRDSCQLICIGTDDQAVYARSLLTIRRRFPSTRHALVSGVPRRLIILAATPGGPFFMFHHPDRGAESRAVRAWRSEPGSTPT